MTTKLARAAVPRGIRTFSRGNERQWLGSSFLDYYTLLCNKKIGSQVWFHCCWSPLGEVRIPCRTAARAHNFCSHKQWCLTVLCELWLKVVFNSNTFFLNWKQWTAVKAVEDALQSKYQNIWSRSVSQNWKGIFRNFRGTSHSTPEQGLEQ